MSSESKNNNDLDGLGVWGGDDFAAAARESRAAGLYVDMPKVEQFFKGTIRLIQRRYFESQRAGGDAPYCALFLLCPNPGERGFHYPRVPTLDNGLTSLAGRVWFISERAVSGRFCEVDKAQGLDEVFVQLESQGFGEYPAITFDSHTAVPELRLYRRGVTYVEECETYPIHCSGSNVGPEKIKDAIDRLHQKCLITSDACKQSNISIWLKPERWMPVELAEKVVQGEVRKALLLSLPTCDVRSEMPDVMGRFDLMVEEEAGRAGITLKHAVLELKILRSHTSTGSTVPASEMKGWIAGGVQQAAAYRTEQNATHAALCCFDMRKEKQSKEDTFADSSANADLLKVHTWVWGLYSASEAARPDFNSKNLSS